MTHAATPNSRFLLGSARARRVCAVLCCAVLLNSCTVRVAYSMLDNILGWQLGQYVSLKGEQKAQSKRLFKDFHAWHRRTQLTLYIDYLETLKQGLIAGNISGTYLHDESDKLQDLIDRSLAALMPGLTNIALSLSDAQVQEVIEQLEKERLEYRDDYVDDTDENVQKRRIHDITRYIGGFFGGFTEAQEEILKNWEQSLEPHEHLMLAQQALWQTQFLDAMQDRSDTKALQHKLHTLLLFRTDNWEPDLQRTLDFNQEHTFDMLAALFNSQTPRQKQKMTRKFDQYIKDLSILASKAEPI